MSQTGRGSSTAEEDLARRATSVETPVRVDSPDAGVRLVDESVVELIEFSVELFARREDAERTLAELLHDEPEWRDLFRIEEIDLGEPSMN